MSYYVGMNYIDGDFCSTRPDFLDENPATEESLGMFPNSSEKEVLEAVAAARKAFKTWKKLSRVHRAEYFDKLAQLMKRDHQKLVDVISLETGKNVNESHAEVVEAMHMCQVAASAGRQSFGEVISSELDLKDAYVERKPKGVVAVISPWNFPLAIGSFWCSAPSIVEGNCVVHKPSELTPMTAQIACELYNEAGFPPGVYNMVHGAGTTGESLVHADVNCILFTGSAEVGQLIRQHCASTWNKTCSCEMGSKSAVMVFDDGSMDLAIDVSIASAFKLSGQRCVSSGRILVQRNILRDFTERFIGKVSKLRTGNPFEDDSPYASGDQIFYGPLISREQMNRVKKFNLLVEDDNDAVVLYSMPNDLRRNGHYLNPFVYRVEWADKPYLKQEVFGPHVALIPFNDIDDAIRIYNDTDYGLALGVVTDDFRKHRILKQECDTGMLYINGPSIGAESHLPFTGIKKSGNGFSSAAGTFEAVTEKIAVTINYEENKIQHAQGMK